MLELIARRRRARNRQNFYRSVNPAMREQYIGRLLTFGSLAFIFLVAIGSLL
jgi:hypothetical protein